MKQDLNGKANALSAGAQAAAEAKHKEALEKLNKNLKLKEKLPMIRLSRLNKSLKRLPERKLKL